jgi:hypothetical protein
MNALVRSMRLAHGANMPRDGRTLLRGALQIAVLDDVLGAGEPGRTGEPDRA